MNIRSVKTEAAPQPPQVVTPQTAKTTAQAATSADSYTPAQNENLVNMLQQQPDIRPEAVERAKSLAADPNYPSSSTIESLAKMFIGDTDQD